MITPHTKTNISDVKNQITPTRTYKINFDTGRIYGFTDYSAAMVQAIRMIFGTDRFKYVIFSSNYGTEWSAVWGKSMPIAKSEAERIIREALIADERIIDITEFSIKQSGKRALYVSFTAHTIFGDVPYEGEIDNV